MYLCVVVIATSARTVAIMRVISLADDELTELIITPNVMSELCVPGVCARVGVCV